MRRVLVTGAAGQIGSDLVPFLRERYGAANVLATDVRPLTGPLADGGPHRRVNCLERSEIAGAVDDHDADAVYHLAAVLSAVGEDDPERTFRVNVEGLLGVLEVARESGCAVFAPSSIAAFGPGTPRDPAPQETVQRPISIYGVTKVTGELLCDYYHARFGVDVRGVRYPGVISHGAPPGGGTTDYAVEIFEHALEGGRYTCFLAPNTQLDLLYMPDVLRAAVELMEAEGASLQTRNAYNITGFQATPAMLADAIRDHLPHFEIEYEVDPVRQRIADSWPDRLDDSPARVDWGWEPEYDLDRMVADMLETLSKKAPAERRYRNAP